VKILLFGGRGQIGWELQRALSPFGDLVVLGRHKADFENSSRIEAVVEAEAPNIVVNAAAYTAVDRAETDFHKARLVNAVAVASLAQAAFAQKALLIHYSTDYVYDGLKTLAYHEDDPTNAMSVYGKTKCEGDEAIVASGCEHLIFRTSWVYWARGNNFVRKILQLASEKSSLTIVADQLGAPTGAEMIADITALAIARRDSGLAARFTPGRWTVHSCDREAPGSKSRLPGRDCLEAGLDRRRCSQRAGPTFRGNRIRPVSA
jgi:dTDP-4-dehydrorhamnose reductase